MDNYNKALPVGIFDSGVGGISVLAEIARKLPYENLIYFGDSGNAPYGTKSVNQVKALSYNVANNLLERGIKALVVACNTATSAAINDLRRDLEIPVVGMEPAVKPAIEAAKEGEVVVMATPLTLKETKFKSLVNKYLAIKEIKPLPCPGLVELIEKGIIEGEEIDNYFTNLFFNIDFSKVAYVVLGCTHYPFVKKEIAKFAGVGVEIIDGNFGTAKRLKDILEKSDLINMSNEKPTRVFLTSGDANYLVPLYESLFNIALLKVK